MICVWQFVLPVAIYLFITEWPFVTLLSKYSCFAVSYVYETFKLHVHPIPAHLIHPSLRPSAAIFAPKSRPLETKIEQVIEVVLENLKDLFSVRDNAQLMNKLKQRRGKGYQLGKSAM